MLKSMHAHTVRPSVLDTVKLYNNNNTIWLNIIIIYIHVLYCMRKCLVLSSYYTCIMHATFKEHYSSEYVLIHTLERSHNPICCVYVLAPVEWSVILV